MRRLYKKKYTSEWMITGELDDSGRREYTFVYLEKEAMKYISRELNSRHPEDGLVRFRENNQFIEVYEDKTLKDLMSILD